MIDNRDKVIRFLNKSNSHLSRGRKFISSWDFTNLYTKIPHDTLKNKISGFIKYIFRSLKTFSKPKNDVCYSPVTKKAYYSVNKSKTNICFSDKSLIDAVLYIIDNSYISYHGHIYRQIIGIPMGTNCAPFIANIYLHTFEYEYIKKLVSKGELNAATLLSNMFRYQDDCIAVNDEGMFAKH